MIEGGVFADAAVVLTLALTASAMASFEDDANPFRTDVDGDLNGTVDRSTVAPDDDDEHQPFREPSPPMPTQDLPPLPAKASSFPRAAPTFSQLANRTEFCCSRDRYLHMEDDAEILVRVYCSARPAAAERDSLAQIVDAQKTAEGSSSPYIVYLIKTGVRCALWTCTSRSFTCARRHRQP